MSKRPLLLDLFCGAGGAAMGYYRVGFDVIGVDIKPQPRYPFEFIQGDALKPPVDLSAFDAIHASPPCQAYTHSAQVFRAQGKIYPDLLAETRANLQCAGVPWVIENVPGAPMRADAILCGCLFSLKGLRRKRWFELSCVSLILQSPCNHDPKELVISVVGHGTPTWVRERWGRCPTVAEAREAMGIDWMSRDELSQAIPPAYTEFIGRQLMQVIA